MRIQSKEQTALIKDHRLGRIHVLGLALAQDTAAKGDLPPTQIINGKQDPIPEAVIIAAAFFFHGKSGLLNSNNRYFFCLQPGGDKFPACDFRGRSVTQAIFINDLLRDVSVPQVFSRSCCLV